MNKRFYVFLLVLMAALTTSAQHKVYISTSFHEPATDVSSGAWTTGNGVAVGGEAAGKQVNAFPASDGKG